MGSILMVTTAAKVVAWGMSHGHRGSEHTKWTHGLFPRLEERHGCREEGALTALTRNRGLAGSHLHDRRGYVAMGTPAAKRARGRWG